MVLSKSTVDELKSDMHEWIDQFIEKQKASNLSSDPTKHESDGKAKPFHNALLPKSFIRMSSFERSFSTSLGKSYERHSAIIARPRFANVCLQHVTEGDILESVDTEISDEVGRINKSHAFSNYSDVAKKIVSMGEQTDGKRVTRSVTSDLYLKDDGENEMFFEIKTPKPNKEQCLNITRKHLWIHAILKNTHPRVATYFGMAYNPYGEGNNYTHSFATRHLDIKHQTLIGKQYWDFLGGGGTFEELLKIYGQIGITKSELFRKMLED